MWDVIRWVSSDGAHGAMTTISVSWWFGIALFIGLTSVGATTYNYINRSR